MIQFFEQYKKKRKELLERHRRELWLLVRKTAKNKKNKMQDNIITCECLRVIAHKYNNGDPVGQLCTNPGTTKLGTPDRNLVACDVCKSLVIENSLSVIYRLIDDEERISKCSLDSFPLIQLPAQQGSPPLPLSRIEIEAWLKSAWNAKLMYMFSDRKIYFAVAKSGKRLKLHEELKNFVNQNIVHSFSLHDNLTIISVLKKAE